MREYLVFARTEFAQDLTHQGSVTAAEPGEACDAALREFGHGWVEMRLLPAGAVRWVLGAPEPVGS